MNAASGELSEALRLQAALSPAGFAYAATIDDPQPYRPSRFHAEISKAVVDAIEGRLDLVLIQCPPQHGKSTTATIWGNVWTKIVRPHWHTIVAAYSTEFCANKLGAPARDALAQHGPRFFGIGLNENKSARDEWESTAGGSFYAAGTDRRIAGRRGDALWIDDAAGGLVDVATRKARDTTWDWFLNELLPRRAPGAPIISIGSRWHVDDAQGRLLEWGPKVRMRMRVLDFPALARCGVCGDIGVASVNACGHGVRDSLGRLPGEALWPEVRDREFLLSMRAGLGSAVFDGPFQGRPHELDAAMFHRAWISHYDVADQQLVLPTRNGTRKVPLSACRIGTFCDLATGIAKASADHTVFTTVAITPYPIEMAVLEVVQIKATAHEQLARLHEVNRRWRPSLIEIETVAGFMGFADHAKAEGLPISTVTPHGSKESRALSLAARMESRTVHFPRQASWLEATLDEVLGFPSGSIHDDIVDTLSMAANSIATIPRDEYSAAAAFISA